MSSSERPEPSEHPRTATTRRTILTLGGGMGLAAFLAACGVRGQPAVPAAATSSAVPVTTTSPAVAVGATAPFVRITTNGTTFNPTVELAAGSTATVSWTIEGGAMVTGINPTISFRTAAIRHVRLTVDDGGADALDKVITLNLGFNHLDDAGTFNMGARHDKPGQAVTLVEDVSLLTGLLHFAAAHTPLTGSLDFIGCSRLQYIECFDSDVQSVNVTGCSSLIRIVVEQTNLTTLDLNPVAATLRDLRGAGQRGGRLTLTPLKAPMVALYHFCVRDQVVVNHPSAAQLPVIEELWDWNTRQSGVLTSSSSAIRSLLTFGNGYMTADLTDQFPAGRNGTLRVFNNNLTSIALTGCSGLNDIDLSNNSLGTVEVDAVLALVASWGTSGGQLNLSANSVPSLNGATSRATLTKRAWTVKTDT
jgi:hypothetical protein